MYVYCIYDYNRITYNIICIHYTYMYTCRIDLFFINFRKYINNIFIKLFKYIKQNLKNAKQIESNQKKINLLL